MGFQKIMAGVLCLCVASVACGTEFDVVRIVKKEKQTRGYRGNNGDLLILQDGSILFCYTEYGDHGGIMAKKSVDQGKTWSEPWTLVPQPKLPAKGRYVHPSLLRIKNGEILLAYNYSTHPAKPYYATVLYRRSADEGQTWTEQLPVSAYPGYNLVHNDKLLSLRDGRIIAVGENKKYMPDSNDHNGYVGLTFYSDDQGHSWHSSKNTVDLYGTRKIEVQEADAVELKDGRLMMFARSYSGYPVRAYSTDRGETWSEGKLIRDLKMPYAGLPTVRRIPSTGDLLFIWVSEKSTIEENGRKLPMRSALTTAISRDEGKTFLHQRNIVQDPTNDFGYQCIEFIDDDLALIAYHTNDGLHLARINVDWFYGEQVDP